jgi:glycosyltransferase involved in cell wall biosynthesis
MRILVAHNYYKQPGGEDQCVAAEVAMLEAHGHEVLQYTLRNESIDSIGRVALVSRTVWSQAAYRDIRDLCRTHRPHIAHFHNTFPLISPAAYYAAKAENVSVLQTLHNFRLGCLNALLFRNGRACEDCLGRAVPWPGLLHRCYRDSLGASGTAALMLVSHRMLGTWCKEVDRYIALTRSSREKLVAAGVPEDRIAIKPNFVQNDPGAGTGRGGYAIFVGRLSVEKGLTTLIEAWRRYVGGAVALKIIGDGPLAPLVASATADDARIEWLGSLPLASVYAAVGDAAFLILPSECYENFPRVLIEAFAKGTPVVTSGLGAMAEIVADGRTGLHFKPGNPLDLALTVGRLLADPERLAAMRLATRLEFEQRYTADANHDVLVAIYRQALAARRAANRRARISAAR